jgi:hypothetical protein
VKTPTLAITITLETSTELEVIIDALDAFIDVTQSQLCPLTGDKDLRGAERGKLERLLSAASALSIQLR